MVLQKVDSRSCIHDEHSSANAALAEQVLAGVQAIDRERRALIELFVVASDNLHYGVTFFVELLPAFGPRQMKHRYQTGSAGVVRTKVVIVCAHVTIEHALFVVIQIAVLIDWFARQDDTETLVRR